MSKCLFKIKKQYNKPNNNSFQFIIIKLNNLPMLKKVSIQKRVRLRLKIKPKFCLKIHPLNKIKYYYHNQVIYRYNQTNLK